MSDEQPLLKIKMGDEVFTLDRLTLGEARILKSEYGMQNLSQFNLANPDVLTGVLVIAYQRAHPECKLAEAVAHVEELDAFSVEAVEDEPDAEAVTADPTQGSTAVEAAEQRAVIAGSPETTPAAPGVPS